MSHINCLLLGYQPSAISFQLSFDVIALAERLRYSFSVGVQSQEESLSVFDLLIADG